MTVFIYARKNVGGRARVGAAAFARLHVSSLFWLALLLVLLIGAANASPCVVYGVTVPCEHFTTSNSSQNARIERQRQLEEATRREEAIKRQREERR